jgi:hypothetical protein
MNARLLSSDKPKTQQRHRYGPTPVLVNKIGGKSTASSPGYPQENPQAITGKEPHLEAMGAVENTRARASGLLEQPVYKPVNN